MPRVSWEDMARYSVVLPERVLADALTRVTSVAFEQIAVNVEQNRTLAELRDMLLPKLLSSEIRVREAEKRVEQAGA